MESKNLVLGSDGSYSLYNENYKQSYHAKSLGALTETMTKHISPALEFIKSQNLTNVRVLDICFGLGFNAFLSLLKLQNAEIFSPELGALSEIYDFPYPSLLDSISPNEALKTLSLESTLSYKTNTLHFFQGNALEYIKKFEGGFFDIVYQDAFSSEYNPELWSKDYFKRLFYITKPKCLVTTYAKARAVLDNARLAGFKATKYKLGSLFYK
ncbi:MnmC family methyltransferase [Helicobacter sp. 11S02629-2]|uniref:MnmC family methyltransferase n=1 Tax=Helicobacter sp. 11S02629-2 TaxID=1476195 RepID=UPI000BA53F74|nr:MnmC family methyltransferase [Helicobacter sp. 11S02629-2]PAF44104.1 hypothetical protein BKH40_06450 [Helicobacter sp. 11S02629-2]